VSAADGVVLRSYGGAMPSGEHESPIALAKLDPGLVAWLLAHLFDVKVPDYHHARSQPTDVRVLVPRTYHADGMLLYCDAADEPVLAVVLEVQRGWDATKRWTWKLYLRHEALRHIPGTAGRNSEGGSWVRWLTSIRKVLQRDSSMPGNQRSCSGARGEALGDPRNMAKAGLLLPQSPGGASPHPPEKRPEPAPHPAPACVESRRNFRGAERCPVRAFKEMSVEPKLRCHV